VRPWPFLLALACGGAAAAPAPPAPRGVAPEAYCVAETNRYRAQDGLPPLERSAELDAFAAAGARADARARRPHQHFSTASYPHPYSQMGENEIPWWPRPKEGVLEVIRQGLAGMYAEGPGGGHHDNLVGPFTHVGCGVHVEGGAVTVVEDFWRL
jgi:uncharacterized protein YkwD